MICPTVRVCKDRVRDEERAFICASTVGIWVPRVSPRREKALEQSSSMNKRKFDETGAEEFDDEDSLGVKLDSQ